MKLLDLQDIYYRVRNAKVPENPYDVLSELKKLLDDATEFGIDNDIKMLGDEFKLIMVSLVIINICEVSKILSYNNQ